MPSPTSAPPPRLGNFVSKDLLASLVVFLVALPLCLGIALASGAPLISGLITGVLGGIVVGLLSGSHTSVSGPAAGLTAVVSVLILKLGSFQTFLAALVLAGGFQIAMGIAQAGFISGFFPSSVIKGLLAAIGVLLILKQFPHAVGHDPNLIGDMAFHQPDGQTTFSEIFLALQSVHPGAAAVGVLCLGLLFFWDHIKTLKNSSIPPALVVVFLGALINEMFMRLNSSWAISSEHLVSVPILEGLDQIYHLLTFPQMRDFLRPEVYTAALTLAAVASLETLLNLEAVDKIDPLRRHSPPNRELLAQGAGNVLCGLIGGIPMTSVIVRSSVNISSGSRSRLSAIFHGVWLLAAVLIFPSLINRIPLSALAAILIITGLKLASPKLFKDMKAAGPRQLYPFLITIVAIVLIDLLSGILIGLFVSLGFILYTNYKRPLRKFLEKHISEDVLRIELSSQVSFFSRATIERTLHEIPDGGHVLIDARNSEYIDPDVVDLMRDFIHHVAPAHDIKVSYLGFKKQYQQLPDQVQFVDYTTKEIQSQLTPEKVLGLLKEGNQRFLSGKRLTRNLIHQVSATASGQSPMAVVLSCIDSRAPTELIFDLGIGDIFTIRIAGNVAREKVLGSMEYACAVAKSKLIVVLGHTGCGAIQASVDLFSQNKSALETVGCEHLDTLVKELQKAIPLSPPPSMEASYLDDVSKRNVQRTVDLISEQSKTLRTLKEKGHIGVVGALYDVRSGNVSFLD